MSTWSLAYDSFAPEEEGLREALTSTGNGYFCTRGTAEWADTDSVHYPGTYMHGGFNRATTMMGGRPVVNEDLVNFPNWLVLKLKIEDEEPFALDKVEVLAYSHEFDIRNAACLRTVRFRDRAGRETTIASRRFVSMANAHLAGIEWTVTPENWSGKATILSGLDGTVVNWGVARYRELETRHLEPITERAVGEYTISLLVRTLQSRIELAQAARTRIWADDRPVITETVSHRHEGYIHQEMSFVVDQGKSVRIEKMVAFYSSRDTAMSEARFNAEQAAIGVPDFAEAFDRHSRAWGHLWRACDVQVPEESRVQQILRFHIAHVLMTCSPITVDLDAGVPARGLTGEAYRGHIFWDELYIYPFLTYRLPEITRSLLMYRYRRLDAARKLAADAGYRGAMFPWQSGSDGSEETQVVHLNPKSGKWDPDLSHNQRHVNAAIFYNIWQYYDATHDIDFLSGYGAEILLEIVRFWASIAHFNDARGRYEIHGVMGPDEFHETLHGSDEEGVRNNAYTNLMVAWMCDIVGKVLETLPKDRRASLVADLDITDDEIALWRDMSGKMFVPFHGDGLISQFEGYETLEELDWDGYRKKYDDIHRLDRVLKAEGDTPDRYKLSKQADTLMLWFLFPEHVLRGMIEGLGYDYSADTARKNTDYYYARCSHGSTLSLIVHADIEADLEPEGSWKMFLGALESDVGDIQGGTTKEGIHMGVMAGTLDLIQRGYLGTEIRGDALHFSPQLTDKLNGLSFHMRFRGTPLTIALKDGALTVAVDVGDAAPVTVGCGDSVRKLAAGESHVFSV